MPLSQVFFTVTMFAKFLRLQTNQWAMPAVNVVGSDSVNGVLEAAAAVKAPVMIQFSNGGSKFDMLEKELREMRMY